MASLLCAPAAASSTENAYSKRRDHSRESVKTKPNQVTWKTSVVLQVFAILVWWQFRVCNTGQMLELESV